MVRVTNGLTRHRRHKAFFARAKGFRLGRKHIYKQTRLALTKQGEHQYKDRRRKKREFRRLWIERLSAAAKARGMSYSRFIGQLKAHDVQLNRKVLSNIAIVFPTVFDTICADLHEK